ncbi:MAG: metalloregulator ArsR/SmtB family transcription factor [Bacteroidota bacterium]
MKTHFNEDFLEKSTETLRAVAHPIRLVIIDMLSKRESLTVTEIYEQLQIEQAVVSHHLRKMKDKNIVKVQREGKNSLYSLTSNAYQEIVSILITVV